MSTLVSHDIPDALRASESALRQAQLTGDVAALDRLIDDELVFTGPDGAIYGKQDDLNAHRNGIIRITCLEPSEERIQRFGGVAVISVLKLDAHVSNASSVFGRKLFAIVDSSGDCAPRMPAGVKTYPRAEVCDPATASQHDRHNPQSR